MNAKAASQFSKYRILGLVGRGQFGRVLCARIRDTGQLVALKELENQRFPTSKLLRELRFLLALQHQNIVACTALIHHQNYRYLVMEYCEGGTLRDLMNQARKLSVQQCFELVNDILLGLEHAHAANIIHCDIKPENVLLKITPKGWQVKISDFGIAKLNQEIDSEGNNTGSPGYMAPERFYGQFSVSSDIYAVGIILYELLVGKRPFSGIPTELMNAHLNQRVSLPETLPRSLQAIIWRSLEKLPQRRYSTAQEMRLDLLKTIGSEDFSQVKTGGSFEVCAMVFFTQKAPHFAQKDLAERIIGLVGTGKSDFYSASTSQVHRHNWSSDFSHQQEERITQSEYKIEAIVYAERTLLAITQHSIEQYSIEQLGLEKNGEANNGRANRKFLYRSAQPWLGKIVWTISPNGDWLAISIGKQLEIRNLVYGRVKRLAFANREITSIVSFDRHHLATIANKFETHESRVMVISRRGNIMYRLSLPIAIDRVLATRTRDRLLLLEADNHKNLFLLDLQPYRLMRIPLEYEALLIVSTTWGYAITANYRSNPLPTKPQTILILLDLRGNNINNLIIDGEVTAIAQIDINLLAIATSEISRETEISREKSDSEKLIYKLYAIDLKKLEVDLVF